LKEVYKKFVLSLSGAAVVVAGSAIPSYADPSSVTKFAEVVGLGSDTTMDVMDGISTALGTNSDGSLKLASYKAVGSADVVVSADGKAIPRANGSTAGRLLLTVAIGQVGSATVPIALDELGKSRTSAVPTTDQVAGKVHYARSSSGPSGAISNGVLTYVPFAYDNMTYATAPVSKIPSDIPVGTAANTSEVSLMNIYKGNITQVITDSSSGDFIKLAAPSYTPAAGETSNTIKAYIPQAGSGTRAFWISKVGITEGNISNGTTAARDTFNGFSVQEHDGSALVGDPYALVGFSIAQWVAQENGVSPKRTQGAVLRTIGGMQPVTQSGSVYSPNNDWSAIKRTVYNIVPTALANAVDDNPIKRAFVGTESLVCQAKDVIQKYGYALLSYTGTDAVDGLTPGGAATICGNITEANRTNAPSSSTVSLGAPTLNASGTSATVRATVASNGNQGGVVNLYSNFGQDSQALVASGTVAANSTTVDIEIANTGSSTWSKTLTAQFVPTLTGIAVSNSQVDGTTVSLKAPTSVTFGAATVAANGLSASFTADLTGSTSGSLKIYNGSTSGTLLKTVSVTSSSVSVTVDQVNGEAVNYKLVGEFVPSDADAFASSTTTGLLDVTLKNSVSSAVVIAASVKRTVVPSAQVTIKDGKATSTVGATGSVIGIVYNSKNVPVAVSSQVKLVAGKATLTFAKIATVGKYTLKVFYGGSVSNPATVITKSFSVVK